MSAAEFPNAATIYSFFLARLTAAGGVNPQAEAAGVTGNILQESGGNPESVQAGGPGRGLEQWSAGGRWQPGLMTGNASADLTAQLNYGWSELTSDPGYGLAALEQQTTPTGAATVFGTQDERYGTAGNRFGYAQQVYSEAQAGTLGTSLDIALLPKGGVGALGNEPGNFVANPGGQISSAAGGIAGDVTGIFSGLLAPFESWALRMGIGLVGVVLVVAALILAAGAVDGRQAPSGLPGLPESPGRATAAPRDRGAAEAAEGAV
jgi:hypothetical protein